MADESHNIALHNHNITLRKRRGVIWHWRRYPTPSHASSTRKVKRDFWPSKMRSMSLSLRVESITRHPLTETSASFFTSRERVPPLDLKISQCRGSMLAFPSWTKPWFIVFAASQDEEPKLILSWSSFTHNLWLINACNHQLGVIKPHDAEWVWTFWHTWMRIGPAEFKSSVKPNPVNHCRRSSAKSFVVSTLARTWYNSRWYMAQSPFGMSGNLDLFLIRLQNCISRLSDQGTDWALQGHLNAKSRAFSSTFKVLSVASTSIREGLTKPSKIVLLVLMSVIARI